MEFETAAPGATEPIETATCDEAESAGDVTPDGPKSAGGATPDAPESNQPTEAQRLRKLIEKAWNTDPDTKLSLFITYLEDDEEFLLAAKYATIIKAALEFE